MQDNKYPLLNRINSPADLRALDEPSTDALAAEIRECLIDTVSRRGGHLASNLGVVELTLALHRVFDTPRDKIIFDVGHQSYVHKLLTGRRDRFDTLRTAGGISGFTKRDESEYDPFGAGHSSTSVSAALGIAEAERIRGTGAYTVAVVGDGAFTGGMIHEALNNCDRTDGLRLIIIINENEMSISKNTGSFANSIARIRTRPSYLRTKAATRGFLSHIPLIGKPLISLLVRVKKMMKNALYGSNYFEDLGLYYIGPVNGNDREMVERMLTEAKKCNESVVLHLKTVKGKGYTPAEITPDEYHSVAPCDASSSGGFSATFGNEMCAAADGDTRVCAITAAMSRGTGLEEFKAAHSDRFFDVGIAEEHAVTFAAGLACDGMKPVCAIYSTFLQRSYDNIIHDVALQHLPVVFCIDRAGLNCSDGATHHGIFDVAFLSEIPALRIYTPATYDILRLCMREALSGDVPAAVRYPNANESERVREAFYPDGKPEKLGVRAVGLEGARFAIAVHGRMASTALDACDMLASCGVACGIILCEYIKPYSEIAGLITDTLPDTVTDLIFLEEEIRSGGFGMNLSDALRRCGDGRRMTVMATDDNFVIPAEGQGILEAAGVDSASVVKEVLSLI